MNRDNIIGLVLIFSLLIAYSIWMTPSKEEIEQKKRQQDSVAQEHQRKLDSIRMITEQRQVSETFERTEIEQPQDIDAERALLVDRFGSFANAAIGQEDIFYLESNILRLGISTKGGRIISAELREFQTWDTLPLYLIDTDNSTFGLEFFSRNRIIKTESLFFEPHWFNPGLEGQNKMKVTGNDSIQFSMRLFAGNFEDVVYEDRFIEFKYTLRGDEYMVGLEINFNNVNRVLDDNINFVSLGWSNQLLRQEKNLTNERNNSTIHFRYLNEDPDYLSETKDRSRSLRTRVKWIGFKQQFFTTTLIARDHFISAEINSFVSEEPASNRYLKSMQADINLPYVASPTHQVALDFYLGPIKYNILRKYGLGLERQVSLGWSFFLLHWVNRFAVIPVFNFLEGFNLNYGIIILILTVLLKIVLFPLTYKTYISQARMRVLKPEVEELNKKFPNKEDAMKKQQALMALYKKAGVNPMSGCVPMVIQLPILIALFRFFPSSIELRQQSFLWAHDLSTYDSVLDLPFTIPFYGDHVSLFTLLMALSTVAYTYVNSKMMDTGANQMPGMKMMMYMMPVMFLGFFNSYSSALSYYYMLTNLITFAQMFLIRKIIDENKIRAKIAENKKKPVKVSGFQKRLEEMAKQRGYKPGKRK